MSIKIVNEIPKPIIKKPNYASTETLREQLYKDIKDAFLSGVSRFELVDYPHQPDYLATIARSVAFWVFKDFVFPQAKEYAIAEVTKEVGNDIKVYVPAPQYNTVIEIHGVTLPDGEKHIYGEIHYDRATAYKEVLYGKARIETMKRYEAHQKNSAF